jgi:hypothetical protein
MTAVATDQNGTVPPQRAAKAACPRCSYDLRGLAGEGAWERSCPLEGRCPECGLDFRWRDIIHPLYTAPKWSFEHARVRLVRRLVWTAVRCMMPRSFFKGMRLELPIVPRRLISLVASAYALMYVLAATQTGATEFVARFSRIYWIWGKPRSILDRMLDIFRIEEHREAVLEALAFPFASVNDFWFTQFAIDGLVFWSCASALTACAFHCLSDTMRVCKVDALHIFRLGVYAQCMIVLLWLAGASCSSAAMIFELIVQPNWTWSLAKRVGQAADSWIAGLVMVLLLWRWWCRATSNYLRLPRSFAVATAMVFIGTSTASLAMWLWPGRRFVLHQGWELESFLQLIRRIWT